MVEHGINPETMHTVTEAALGLYALSMAFSFGLKKEIRERQNYRCDSCGRRVKRPSNLQIHHRTPQSLGGPDTIDNAVGLCQGCHTEADKEAFQGIVYPQTHDQDYYFSSAHK